MSTETLDNRPHPCRECAKMGKKWKDACPHGGGGGGDDEADDSLDNSKSEQNGPANSATSLFERLFELVNKPDMSAAKNEEVKEIGETKFNPSVIIDLILKGLLVIKNEMDIGRLSFICLAPILEPKELAKFFNAIKQELANFVLENKIGKDGFKITPDINERGELQSFFITLANPAMYTKFIQRLEQNIFKQLVADDKRQEKNNHFNPDDYRFNPTPFSTKCERK